MATLTSPSLGKLITNVRNFLNQPNSNNSTWSDIELTEYLNEGVRLYANEVMHHGDGQFKTKSSLNIVTDTETIALPSDCFIVIAVRKKVSSGYVPLNYRPDFNEGYSTQGGTSSENYQPYYTFQGNNLVFRPIPNFSETAGIEIEYIAFPDVMVNATDTLSAQVLPIFKNLIEMYAVYKAKVKESLAMGVNTYAVAKENVNDLYVSFKEAIGGRSQSRQFIEPFNPELE